MKCEVKVAIFLVYIGEGGVEKQVGTVKPTVPTFFRLMKPALKMPKDEKGESYYFNLPFNFNPFIF